MERQPLFYYSKTAMCNTYILHCVLHYTGNNQNFTFTRQPFNNEVGIEKEEAQGPHNSSDQVTVPK